MADLSQEVFTQRADLAESDDGWFLGQNITVKTLAGDDSILGTRDMGEGLENTGRIQTERGDDTIFGETTLTTNGNGIYNAFGGSINGGPGDDRIHGRSIQSGLNNDANSLIDGGPGNDLILGEAETAILVGSNARIRGGGGRDSIIGDGLIVGISNRGRLEGGSGNDTITGSGSVAAIDNAGEILAGSGNDSVDGLIGGFSGTGITRMGSGRDRLVGFGSGQFFGDAGRDTLLLPEGVYTVDAGQGTISNGTTTMQVFSFERIGGSVGGLFTFASGTLSVDASGNGSFA
jgi:hypothetical protein